MAQEELILDGNRYVSSKRASELSQYAHDYIGQLCRGGHVDCKRVGGMWYVTLESLEKHKSMSAEVKSRAFSKIESAQHMVSDTVLTFSGEEYVSSKHGAEITGYNADYITQLARSGKVRARQMGSRWYVARKDLVENKDRNDSMLAAVQAESAGVQKNDEKLDIYNKKEDKPTTYSEDPSPLMPALRESESVRSDDSSVKEKSPEIDQQASEKTEVVGDYEYRYARAHRGVITPPRAMFDESHTNIPIKAKKSGLNTKLVVSAGAVVVIAGAFLMVGTYLNLKNTHISASRDTDSAATLSGYKGLFKLDFNDSTFNILILLVTDVIHYQRIPRQ
jgi:hypothetical protein